ncbi:hypothetical protein E2C01_020390 [Portunus trituberculatus]|uniref:Uncharacterized protein n=1 Tax=Portunus trituberculatus TaxID=210409 RepID=A0A5B7E1W6_PORTR|nr:hypothetical protein [Portunus trituberculatus]
MQGKEEEVEEKEGEEEEEEEEVVVVVVGRRWRSRYSETQRSLTTSVFKGRIDNYPGSQECFFR